MDNIKINYDYFKFKIKIKFDNLIIYIKMI
jgi:hypothetical protein